MAIIHYQFESIHPFYDGNGRTGRIINILYLILKDLLDIPILYLSRYIIKNKEVKEKLPKIYSKDLIEILFMHPYTKIDFLVDKLGITRQTASKYLKELQQLEIIKSIQIKNSKYFVNSQLFAMLQKGI